ncbi:type II toxin-antitoxin system prevent-host-death family antitoxin [Rhodobacteraceae bacterium CCMM004]|nr:type II toxin-antitoxin system prevent-host-death family antitoxin [Rhodobacteraceae bacterium CCMM004]
MKTDNMHEARTHLSRLIEAAVAGEDFVVARAGKPLVRVSRIDAPEPRRPGVLAGQAEVPEDFDEIGAQEIAALFAGSAG